MRLFEWIIIAAAVILVAWVAVGWFLFRMAIVRHKPKKSETDKDENGNTVPDLGSWSKYSERINEGRGWFIAQNPERVEINSEDGLKLVGWYLPAENAKRTIVSVHGYHSDCYRDFSCSFKFYHECGCNILSVNNRAHGESEGVFIGFGVLDRYDIALWVDYLNTRFGNGTNIFLDGLSMGAAAVLMAAGLKLPLNVRGIIADCGFTSPWDEFSYVLRRDYHFLAYPLLPMCSLISRLIAGYGFKDCSTLDAMKKCKVPVLFIHGSNDNFVPAEMSRRNYEACVTEKELVIVEGAGHAESYLVDTDKCQKAMKSFLERYTEVS